MTLVRSIVDELDGICRARTTDLAAGRLAEAVTTSRSFGEESDLGQTQKSARLNGKSVLPPITDLVGPPRHVRVVPNPEVEDAITQTTCVTEKPPALQFQP